MGTSQIVYAWTFDPGVLAGLALLLGGYLLTIGPVRRRFGWGEAVPRSRVLTYLAGWLALALSLISPLDALGREYSFTMHTTQLFLLITLVAPLLLIGLPDWLVSRLLLHPAIREATRGLLFTVAAIVGFNAIILLWHIGRFYEAALHSMPLHDLQNLSFLVAGILTWWPLLTPTERRMRLSNMFQILYLVAESLPLDIFGVAAIFAPGPFYPTYVAAPRLFGLSPLLDQQVAGAILSVPGNFLDIVLMSIIFFAWIDRVESSQRRREATLYAEDDAATPAPAVETAAVGETGVTAASLNEAH